MIPKTDQMYAEEYDPGSGIARSFIGHLGIATNEMDTEESDTDSYASGSFVEGEEMEHDYNEFYAEKYMSDEDSEIKNYPMCFCGRLAKKRLSMTTKNFNRWFFNCPKRNFNTQCGYFQWCDELYEDDDGVIFEDDDGDMGGIDNKEDEYKIDEEEVESNHLKHEDKKMVLREEKSSVTCQASTASIQVDQVKEMSFFPQYPDLSLLVQEHKPDIELDGCILSLAQPG